MRLHVSTLLLGTLGGGAPRKPLRRAFHMRLPRGLLALVAGAECEEDDEDGGWGPACPDPRKPGLVGG